MKTKKLSFIEAFMSKNPRENKNLGGYKYINLNAPEILHILSWYGKRMMKKVLNKCDKNKI